MKAITHNDIARNTYTEQYSYTASKSLWEKFIEFSDRQEYNRLAWVVIGILGHGTIFTIGTLAAVTLLGNIFVLYIIACCSMVMVVAVNLAALPTKYTVPIFFLSLLIDLGVVITAIILHYSF
jgi:hypothetical protein